MTSARQATPTVTFVDEHCREYQDLFPDVRGFEHFRPVKSLSCPEPVASLPFQIDSLSN